MNLIENESFAHRYSRRMFNRKIAGMGFGLAIAAAVGCSEASKSESNSPEGISIHEGIVRMRVKAGLYLRERPTILPSKDDIDKSTAVLWDRITKLDKKKFDSSVAVFEIKDPRVVVGENGGYWFEVKAEVKIGYGLKKSKFLYHQLKEVPDKLWMTDQNIIEVKREGKQYKSSDGRVIDVGKVDIERETQPQKPIRP